MLSIDEATKVVKTNHPSGKIQSHVEYRNLYLFMVFNNRPGEEEFDPFFSVNKETGKFEDFSVITDGDISEIMTLFAEAKSKG